MKIETLTHSLLLVTSIAIALTICELGMRWAYPFYTIKECWLLMYSSPTFKLMLADPYDTIRKRQ